MGLLHHAGGEAGDASDAIDWVEGKSTGDFRCSGCSALGEKSLSILKWDYCQLSPLAHHRDQLTCWDIRWNAPTPTSSPPPPPPPPSHSCIHKIVKSSKMYKIPITTYNSSQIPILFDRCSVWSFDISCDTKITVSNNHLWYKTWKCNILLKLMANWIHFVRRYTTSTRSNADTLHWEPLEFLLPISVGMQ